MNLIKGLVSIVMPCYNSQEYVEETINTILRQTYEHWELIIIDDCSTDNTVAIIETLVKQNNNIHLIKLGINKGQAHARNVGIQKCLGQFLTFIDSDDLWDEQFLEICIKNINEKKCEIVFTAFERKNITLSKSFGILNVPQKVMYNDLLKNNYFSCLTTVIDLEKVGKIYFEENYKHEDHIYWLKLMKNIPCAYGINKNLAIYRIRRNSTSRNKLRAAKWKWIIYRKYLRFNILKSGYYFTYYLFYGILKNCKFIIKLK